jgi:hypothetical protein
VTGRSPFNPVDDESMLVRLSQAVSWCRTRADSARPAECLRSDRLRPWIFQSRRTSPRRPGHRAVGRRLRRRGSPVIATEAHSLDDPIEMVGRFLNPVLAGSARGSWDPHLKIWKAR